MSNSFSVICNEMAVWKLDGQSQQFSRLGSSDVGAMYRYNRAEAQREKVGGFWN
jgi:hypothetical protein